MRRIAMACSTSEPAKPADLAARVVNGGGYDDLAD